jgi:hypothetical protein
MLRQKKKKRMEHTSIVWPEIREGGAAMRLRNAQCRTCRSSWTRKSRIAGWMPHMQTTHEAAHRAPLWNSIVILSPRSQHTTMSPANFKYSKPAMNEINSAVGKYRDESPEKVEPIPVWLQFFSIRQPLVVPFDAQQDESIFLVSAT